MILDNSQEISRVFRKEIMSKIIRAGRFCLYLERSITHMSQKSGGNILCFSKVHSPLLVLEAYRTAEGQIY